VSSLLQLIGQHIHIRELALHGVIAGQGAQPTDDVAGPNRLGGDLSQRLADFKDVRVG
jgi:hypothetical protein